MICKLVNCIVFNLLSALEKATEKEQNYGYRVYLRVLNFSMFLSVRPYVKLVNNKVLLNLHAFPLLCGKMKQLTMIVYRKHAITVGLKVYVTVQVLIQDIPNNLCRFLMGGYLSVVVIEVFFFFFFLDRNMKRISFRWNLKLMKY